MQIILSLRKEACSPIYFLKQSSSAFRLLDQIDAYWTNIMTLSWQGSGKK